MRKLTAILALLFISTFIAACGDNDSDEAAKKDVHVMTPEGQMSLSRSGELPPNWPADFPLPSNSTPLGSGSLGGSDNTGMAAIYRTSTSPEDALKYYTSSSSLTFTEERSAGRGDKFAGSIKLTSPYVARVTVANYQDGTVIIARMLEGSSTTTSTSTSTTTR